MLANIALGAMDASRGKTEKKVKIQFRKWGHFWIFCMMKKKRIFNHPRSSGHVNFGKKLKMWSFGELPRWNASEVTPVGVKRKWFFFKILVFKICEGNKFFHLYTWTSTRHVFVKNFQKWVSMAYFRQFFVAQNATTPAVVGMFWSQIFKIENPLHILGNFLSRKIQQPPQ